MMQAPIRTGGAALHIYAIVVLEQGSGVGAGPMPDDLELIQRGPFAAVVGPETGEPLMGHDRVQLARRLMVHQQVIERMMAAGPVLPVKFGTVAPDRESVEQCLQNGAEDFAAALERLQGKTQFEVLVTWNLEAVFAEIAEAPEVARAKAELAAVENPDAEAAVRLGKLVQRALERRRSELAEHLSRVLRDAALDSIGNPLMDDHMVLNLALLVDTKGADALDRSLEALDAAHDGELTFRCIGPLPPHSFATVEVTFLDHGEIARACEKLGFSTAQDAETVRTAFRRLAKRTHPDLDAAHADGQGMMELHDAYKTLSAYAEAGGPVVVSVCRQEAAFAGGPV